jgi:hypothetical protein
MPSKSFSHPDPMANDPTNRAGRRGNTKGNDSVTAGMGVNHLSDFSDLALGPAFDPARINAQAGSCGVFA